MHHHVDVTQFQLGKQFPSRIRLVLSERREAVCNGGDFWIGRDDLLRVCFTVSVPQQEELVVVIQPRVGELVDYGELVGDLVGGRVKVVDCVDASSTESQQQEAFEKLTTLLRTPSTDNNILAFESPSSIAQLRLC